MKLVDAEKIWMPRFLLEGAVRGYAQALYVAIVGSHENAKNLLSYEPGTEAANVAGGSRLARNCFYWVIRWLAHLREYSVSHDVFVEQFLEPARCSARFKIGIESTTSSTALVFSKSEGFYDQFFQSKVSTLSLIVPSMECSMSLRCREESSASVTFGSYELGGIQPLPYVNRIHPVRLSLQKANKVASLGVLDFLKVAPADLMFFSHSLALENYCEIESIQFGKRRLGATCIVSGRLVSAALPQLIIQSLSHPDLSVQMLATSHLLNNMNCDSKAIESLEGRNVRVLCSVWYTCGSKEESRYPEAFYVEPVSNPSELIWDEIIGRVRLHGSCSQEAAEKLLQGPFEKSTVPPVLSLETDGSLHWVSRQTTSDRITNLFLQEGERLRQLRQLLGDDKVSAVVFERHRILDLANLRQNMLAQRLIRDQALMDSLTDLLRKQDSEGEIGRSFSALVKSFSEPNQEHLMEKLWWLRDFGFLAKTKSGMRITERGLEVAYSATGQTLKGLAKVALSAYKQDAAFLGDVASVTKIPPSLMLKALKEIEDGWLRCLTIGGERCELIWIVEPDGGGVIGKQRLEEMQSRVLNVLGKVHYPLATSKILDQVRTGGMTHFVLALLLNTMRSQAIVTEPEDGMWFYPWEKRIEDILSQDPHPVLDADELIKAAGIPYVEKGLVLRILNKLKEKHVAKELEKGKWAIESSNETVTRDQLSWLLRADCRDYILNDLRTQGGWVQIDRLSSDTRLFLRRRMEHFRSSDELETRILENCLRDLQREGKLAKAGSIVRLVRDSPT